MPLRSFHLDRVKIPPSVVPLFLSGFSTRVKIDFRSSFRPLSLSLFTANGALEPDRIIGDKRKREIAGDGERASRDLYLNFTGREEGRQPGKFLWPITVERRQILIGYSPVGSGNRRDIGSHPPSPPSSPISPISFYHIFPFPSRFSPCRVILSRQIYRASRFSKRDNS